MADDRDRLVALVERLMAGSYANEVELDRDTAELESSVLHPRALDLIFHWEDEFDREPTSEDVVERALSYRPIEM